jgi:uncharacterized protein
VPSEVLTVCRLDPGVGNPPRLAGGGFASVTHAPFETSVVCRASRVPFGVRTEAPWRALRATGRRDLRPTGILASLLAPLAASGVAVFTLSTFDTDYVRVRQASLQAACTALSAAGHRIQHETL